MNKTYFILITLLLSACGREETQINNCKTYADFLDKSSSESFETLTYELPSCLNIHDIPGPGKLNISIIGAPDGFYTLSNLLTEQKTPTFTLPLPRDENHYLLQIRRPSSTTPASLRLDINFARVP
jgi:hypothetical protein